MPRRTWLVLGAVALVAVVAAAAYGFGGRNATTAGPEAAATTVAEVTRMDLIDYKDATGEVGFGAVSTLRYTPPPPGGSEGGGEASGGRGGGGQGGGGGGGEATGTQATGIQTSGVQSRGIAAEDDGLGLVTWLPPIGSTVDRGGTLFRVDDRPVILLVGALPVYRTLRSGVTGADVRQFEENLAALGVTGFTVDDQYTDSTDTAVRRWQKNLGLPQTGQIAPGQVVYAAGSVRIADHRLRVGDVANGDIVGVTGTARVATAVVDAVPGGIDIEPGSAVTLLFADSAEVPATVRAVTNASTDPQALTPTPQLVVEAEVADQALLAEREGPVTMRFVVAERKDVLAVPVVALVALAEGGHGVQVVEGSATRYVAVETGLFARGFVEITSGDLHPGMSIVVPS